MIRPMTENLAYPLAITTHTASSLPARLTEITRFVYQGTEPASLSRHPAWLQVLNAGLGHPLLGIEARMHGHTCGWLPLIAVETLLFGRFLVSLPYLNSNGVSGVSVEVQQKLIDQAVRLADELNVRHLELRHEEPVDHPAWNARLTSKVHMRKELPETTDLLWKQFDAKVRNQVRKGEKNDLQVAWGGGELLEPFYQILSHNMRDLGTPVYGRELFRLILDTFPGDAEICLVSQGSTPIATALLLHGPGVTEVPTASSLREYNATCANMLMYRHLLDRAVLRGQKIFDFGRSTENGPTHQFKKQWGAAPVPATWQYWVRQGALGEMRPDNPRYQRLIRIWQKLPLRLTQTLGPWIVRGIP